MGILNEIYDSVSNWITLPKRYESMQEDEAARYAKQYNDETGLDNRPNYTPDVDPTKPDWGYSTNDTYNTRGYTTNDTYGYDYNASPSSVNPFVQNIRNLGYAGAGEYESAPGTSGSIPMVWTTNDDTNCTFVGGLAAPGTIYEGVYNIDDLIARAKKADKDGLYGGNNIFRPDSANYQWQPGDAEIWDGHVIYRTENGGRIQAGSSFNGIYETDNPNELFGYTGKPDYVVRMGQAVPQDNPAKVQQMLDSVYGNREGMDRARYNGYFSHGQNRAESLAYDPGVPMKAKNRVVRFYNDYKEKHNK